MALAINTNSSSLNAQNSLSKTQASLSTSMARLSSGLRINGAKDDSAGLSISQRFTAQIRGNDQAARNANDGISLAQTAEGDLEQIGDNLQRIRELAVQSANATNSASDRQSINNEATQLVAEIDRIASGSNFNGTKLLDGSFTSKIFQVGANNTSNDKITISSVSSAKASQLLGAGNSYSTTIAATGNTTTTALALGDLSINGYQVGASVSDGVSTASATASAIAKANAINSITAQTGVTATVGATTTTAGAVAATAGAKTISVNGVAISYTATASAIDSGNIASAAINAKTAQTGVTAAFNTTTGAVTLTAADGRNIDVAATTATHATDLGLSVATTSAKLTLSSSGSAGIALGGAAAVFTALGAGITAGVTAATVSTSASVDLTSVTGAQAALDTIDNAINSVNSSRAALGAFQNRFEATVTNLNTKTENLSASRGRITDADFAKETANLSRAQVLQQAGTAMLAQANQSGQGVLSLLR